MLDKDLFFEKYKISGSDFIKSGLRWTDLQEIYTHHQSRMEDLDITGKSIIDGLRNESHVHSLKFRVKDPQH